MWLLYVNFFKGFFKYSPLFYVATQLFFCSQSTFEIQVNSYGVDLVCSISTRAFWGVFMIKKYILQTNWHNELHQRHLWLHSFIPLSFHCIRNSHQPATNLIYPMTIRIFQFLSNSLPPNAHCPHSYNWKIIRYTIQSIDCYQQQAS